MEQTPLNEKGKRVPRWLVSEVLHRWESGHPTYENEPIMITLRRRKGVARAIQQRWAGPITVGARRRWPHSPLPALPKDQESKAFDPSTIKTDPLLEPYHLLRTNLRFAWADTTPKTVLVTSAEMGEGKTTILANLGVALAITGKRVVG